MSESKRVVKPAVRAFVRIGLSCAGCAVAGPLGAMLGAAIGGAFDGAADFIVDEFSQQVGSLVGALAPNVAHDSVKQAFSEFRSERGSLVNHDFLRAVLRALASAVSASSADAALVKAWRDRLQKLADKSRDREVEAFFGDFTPSGELPSEIVDSLNDPLKLQTILWSSVGGHFRTWAVEAGVSSPEASAAVAGVRDEMLADLLNAFVATVAKDEAAHRRYEAYSLQLLHKKLDELRDGQAEMHSDLRDLIVEVSQITASPSRLLTDPEFLKLLAGLLEAVLSDRLTQNRAEQKGAELWTIPRPSSCFTGQSAYLDAVRATLAAGRRGGITQTAGLRGQGGIGKTELALAYAQIYADDYQEGHFVVADSITTLDFNLARIADPLLSEETATPEEVQAAKTRAMVRLQASPSLLLIFDNVDDIAGDDRFKRDVVAALPRAHILLTCRHGEMGINVAPIPVDKMEDGVAALFLLRAGLGQEAGGPWHWEDFSEEDRREAAALAREFDGLPLALHHAGCAIRGESVSVAELRASYARDRRRILENRNQSAEAYHPESIWLTVVHALEKLKARDPAAEELVIACAYMAPEAIFEDYFTEGMIKVKPILSDSMSRFLDLRTQAIRSGLVERLPAEKRLTIHRVAQTVIRDCGDEASERWGSVGNTLVVSLLNSGRFREGSMHAELVVHSVRDVLGARHPDTLTSMSNLASTYYTLGRHEEALAMKEDVLALRRDVLGARHPDTLKNMNNLAATYSALGRHEEALAMKEDVLALRRDVLGARHPDTLTSMSNLAETYSALGRHEEALAMKEDVLALRRDVLGGRHPNTLGSMNNLAITYWRLEMREQAITLMEEAFTAFTEVLGSGHPTSILFGKNLAVMRQG